SGSSGSTSIGVTQVAGADTSSDTTDTDTDDTSEDAENEETEDAADEEETDADDDGITVIESDKGTIWFVPITGLEQGKDLFEEIIGRDDCYVDFQMLDAAETVLYAWEFCGSDVTVAEDMIFTIDSSTTAFEGCSYGSSSDSVYLSFAQEGDFVGNTTVYMKVDKYFADDEVLNLYQYDAENDEVTLLQEGLENESGYVTMELAADEGGELILTKQTLETVEAAAEGAEEDEDLSVDEVTNTKSETTATSSHKGAIAAVIIIIIIVVVIIICALLLRKRKKGGPEDGDADDDTEEPESCGSAENTDGNEGIEEDPDDDADKNDGIGEEPDVETTDDSESEP
ncbi:MAG: hypothetical protein LUH46_10730, partial [Alistipes sp.]|nr:hypothetical protein [Alistipes sp.]